jgi:hypothetical protein
MEARYHALIAWSVATSGSEDLLGIDLGAAGSMQLRILRSQALPVSRNPRVAITGHDSPTFENDLWELLATSLAGLQNEKEEVKLLLDLAHRCQAQGPDASTSGAGQSREVSTRPLGGSDDSRAPTRGRLDGQASQAPLQMFD